MYLLIKLKLDLLLLILELLLQLSKPLINILHLLELEPI